MKKYPLLKTTAIGLTMLGQSCTNGPKTKQDFMAAYDEHAWNRSYDYQMALMPPDTIHYKTKEGKDTTEILRPNFFDEIDSKTYQMNELMEDYKKKFGTDMADDYEKLYGEKLTNIKNEAAAPDPEHVPFATLSRAYENDYNTDTENANRILRTAREYHKTMNTFSDDQVKMMDELASLKNELSKTSPINSKTYDSLESESSNKEMQLFNKDKFIDSVRKEYEKSIGHPMPEDWGTPNASNSRYAEIETETTLNDDKKNIEELTARAKTVSDSLQKARNIYSKDSSKLEQIRRKRAIESKGHAKTTKNEVRGPFTDKFVNMQMENDKQPSIEI